MPIKADAWVAEDVERARRQKMLDDEMWPERQKYHELMREEVPSLKAFEHLLESNLNVKDALALSTLSDLRDKQYCRTISEHINGDKLRAGFRPWALEWVTRGGLGVQMDPLAPRTDHQWHRVELVAKLDAKKRILDTEFFSMNAHVGNEANTYDDREKLHLVWYFPKNSEEDAELIYVGMGTNEPYDLEHPEPFQNGRPRFYIYDSDRNIEFVHKFTETDHGPYDMSWIYAEPIRAGMRTSVDFVRLIDGSPISLADPEMLRVLRGRFNAEHVAMAACRAFDLEREDLDEETLQELLTKVRRSRIEVSSTVAAAPAAAPTIASIIDEAELWYPAYFYAYCAQALWGGTQSVDRLIRLLPPVRRDEYLAEIGRPVADIFDEADLPLLPGRMSDLFSLRTDDLPAPVKTNIERWRLNIYSELRRDLYHYGQNPIERCARLLLGVRLAMSADDGDVYGSFLRLVRRHLDGQAAYGQLDVDWTRRDTRTRGLG